MYKTWKEAPEDEWADLLTLMDPDWTDHFVTPEQGLAMYEEFGDNWVREPDPIVFNALKEMYGNENDT